MLFAAFPVWFIRIKFGVLTYHSKRTFLNNGKSSKVFKNESDMEISSIKRNWAFSLSQKFHANEIVAHIFSLLMSAAGVLFASWLARLVLCVCFDWLIGSLLIGQNCGARFNQKKKQTLAVSRPTCFSLKRCSSRKVFSFFFWLSFMLTALNVTNSLCALGQRCQRRTRKEESSTGGSSQTSTSTALLYDHYTVLLL